MSLARSLRMPRALRPLLVKALAGACLALALSGCGRGERERPVRLVLITVDTLRKGAWSEGEGREAPMQRTLARLRGGLVFERAYSATSSTQPTHASLFTGLHPWEHGVTRNGLVLGEEHETLPERLRRAGWETRAVVASFPMARGFGFEQGFLAYDDAFEHRLGEGTWNEQEVEDNAFYSLCDDVTARALAALDAARAPRQFLWVHYFDPHDPYGDGEQERSLDVGTLRQAAIDRDPRLPQLLRKARQLYFGDVIALDGSLERLLARLERDAQRFETHVVITADHGESFGEDGSMGHGSRVSASQVLVPLGILSPRAAPGERRDVCGSIDVFATLLDLAGLQPVAGAGRSLLAAPPGDGGRAYGMRRTFDEPRLEARTDGSGVPVDLPRFFAIAGEGHYAGRAGAVEVLPDETPLADEVLAGELSQLFARFEEALGLSRAAERSGEDVQRALRALGYAR